jgi:hypothetical protein
MNEWMDQITGLGWVIIIILILLGGTAIYTDYIDDENTFDIHQNEQHQEFKKQQEQISIQIAKDVENIRKTFVFTYRDDNHKYDATSEDIRSTLFMAVNEFEKTYNVKLDRFKINDNQLFVIFKLKDRE